MAGDTASPDFTEHAAEIVGAYVAHNSVPVTELPNLLRTVHDTLASLGKPEPVEAPAEALKPAVPVRRSVTDEFIISLEDGRKLKSMKRYLAGLGMTPAEYRAKWNLPSDYPMVAPSYAAKRSEFAKSMKFGHKRVEAASELASASELEAAAPVPAPKRGRAKKAA